MTPSARKLQDWRGNVAQFAWENCQFKPDKWQKGVFDVFPSQEPDKIRISMQACATPGKTAGLAICGLNFLSCYGTKGEHPKGAAVAITGDNLSANLWPEIAKWMDRSEYLRSAFEWTKTRVFARDHPATWFLEARTYAKTANPEEQGRTLSGLHSKFILYLIDEAGDIYPAILRSAEQGLSGDSAFKKLIIAGNPTSHEGMLYHASARQPHLWHIVRVTGDPDDPDRSQRIDIGWAREQISLHGRDNPWVMAYILGQFPPSGLNVLLGPDQVDAAMKRHLPDDAFDWAQKRLGVDVARFGDDLTVIFPRQGMAAFKPVVMRHQRTTDIAARVAMARESFKPEMIFVDDSGHWGHGVIDNLIAAGHPATPILFEEPALDPRYMNRRTEMIFKLADWIKNGGAIPCIPEMVRELTALSYTFIGGKLAVAKKEQIKKLIHASTDYTDALALTFAIPDMPKDAMEYSWAGLGKPGKLQSEWEPYQDE